MDFFRTRIWAYWMEIMLSASPHSRMEGLTTSSRLDYQLYCLSQSLCRNRREKKKIHLLNVVLGTEHFLKVYMGAILLYGSAAEIL